jgi:hemerythrin-like domain-containing protein
MSAAALTRPDTSDMLAVHRVFRESLGVAPQLIGSVPGEDTERVAAVAGYYADILAFLRVHHEGEDELLWPKLIARCPEEAQLISRIAGQHDGVLSAIETAETHLAAWRAEPTIDNAATLAAALITLAVGLGAHLDEEERLILPIAGDNLSTEEWAELPAHGMQNFKGERIWLVLGLIREQMTDAQRDAMDAHMPPPVHDFWVNIGEPQFTAFITDIRR